MRSRYYSAKARYCKTCGRRVFYRYGKCFDRVLSDELYDAKGSQVTSLFTVHKCSKISSEISSNVKSALLEYANAVNHLDSQYDDIRLEHSRLLDSIDRINELELAYEWKYALSIDCSKCGQPRGLRCLNMRPGFEGKVIKRPHAERLPPHNDPTIVLYESQKSSIVEQINEILSDVQKATIIAKEKQDCNNIVNKANRRIEELLRCLDFEKSVSVTIVELDSPW